MATEYIKGSASAEAIARLEMLRQSASDPKRPIFDATNANGRMLFFAFDGTQDNKNNASLGPMSNVGRLSDAAESAFRDSGGATGKAFYYEGPGNQENSVTRLIDSATGMTVPTIVASAYNDLVAYANANPNLELTISTTGFSRGAATARAFLNAVAVSNLKRNTQPRH